MPKSFIKFAKKVYRRKVYRPVKHLSVSGYTGQPWTSYRKVGAGTRYFKPGDIKLSLAGKHGRLVRAAALKGKKVYPKLKPASYKGQFYNKYRSGPSKTVTFASNLKAPLVKSEGRRR